MTDDTQLLRDAAERARALFPPALARHVTVELERGIRGLAVDPWLTARCSGYTDLAKDVLSLPVPDTAPDREALGRKVREVWIEWAREQPNPKASWLVPWEGLAEPDREVDRRIGETLAAYRAAADTATRDAVAQALSDATREWLAMQNSITAESWEGTWDEFHADALVSRGYIRQPVTAEQVEAAALKAKAREGCEIRWDLIGPAYRKEIRAVLEGCGIEVASDE